MSFYMHLASMASLIFPKTDSWNPCNVRHLCCELLILRDTNTYRTESVGNPGQRRSGSFPASRLSRPYLFSSFYLRRHPRISFFAEQSAFARRRAILPTRVKLRSNHQAKVSLYELSRTWATISNLLVWTQSFYLSTCTQC
jgi:hypothetical protein